MKMKFILALISLTILFLLSPQTTRAQMMRNVTPMTAQVSVTPSAQDLSDIQTGQELYTKFQNKEISCTTLQDADFEKIGEYLMNQSFGGNANVHIQMNNTMKQMMGENGEEQMHIRLAKNATGCNINGQGGGNTMMGWGGYGNMMNGAWGIGLLGFIFWIVLFVDLILLGMWLWKQLQKK